MSWNYRLMRHGRTNDDDHYFAVHEVYYNKAGEIDGYTAEPVYPTGETFAEFQEAFDLYQRAATCAPPEVLNYDELEADAAKRRAEAKRKERS